ncbi:hypothetical protein LTR17_015158 [Elasticomyces elasticus]|nr:hypothetical protein LTR17_015158 [Elasticomyces elasticus]
MPSPAVDQDGNKRPMGFSPCTYGTVTRHERAIAACKAFASLNWLEQDVVARCIEQSDIEEDVYCISAAYVATGNPEGDLSYVPFPLDAEDGEDQEPLILRPCAVVGMTASDMIRGSAYTPFEEMGSDTLEDTDGEEPSTCSAAANEESASTTEDDSREFDEMEPDSVLTRSTVVFHCQADVEGSDDDDDDNVDNGVGPERDVWTTWQDAVRDGRPQSYEEYPAICVAAVLPIHHMISLYYTFKEPYNVEGFEKMLRVLGEGYTVGETWGIP